jgi:hypothetical protein
MVIRRTKRAISRDHLTGWVLIGLSAAMFRDEPKAALLLLTRRPCAAELRSATLALRTPRGRRVVLVGGGAAVLAYAAARFGRQAPAAPA